TPKTNSRRTSGRRKFEIRGLVRKNKYSQHVIVNELGVDNYGLADSNNQIYHPTNKRCNSGFKHGIES
ncbi:hypothetical protein, partial [Bacteroides heparinolyticus]|uniref:hypothetical protein n=1 Tax=Prevotella heparinolytica TaxID=28113 RepID=UPI0023F63C70